jgi:hypothetical protein
VFSSAFFASRNSTNGEKDLRQALERPLRQLELGQFANEKGEKITDNYAFVEAKKVLKL